MLKSRLKSNWESYTLFWSRKIKIKHTTVQGLRVPLGHAWWTDPTHRANRNWELWEEEAGLLSPTALVLTVDELGGGIELPVLLGLLPRRVAWRPASTCCRAACACCRSSCSCIWSCCSWEAEGPDEFIWPPAARRTPDSWDNNSAGDTRQLLVRSFKKLIFGWVCLLKWCLDNTL